MRKFLSLFLSIALAVSVLMLSGCSGSSANNKDIDLKETVNSGSSVNNKDIDLKETANSGSSANYMDIDLKETVKITLAGYNGSGYAEVTIDNGKVKDLLEDEDTELAFKIIGSLEIAKIENNGQLSNGDNINIKVKYSDSIFEQAKINAVNTEFQYEISGLEEKEKLDLFKDVELVITPVIGDETKCKLYALYTGDNHSVGSKFHSGVFEITGEDGNTVTYKDKDKVYFNLGEKVTVSVSEKSIKDNSYWFELTETSKEYVISVE